MLRKSSHTGNEFHDGQHRFEHWYRDNTIYFITARCRDRTMAFESDACKEIFWDRASHYMAKYDFKPILFSLLDNHYHGLGYLKNGENLGPMMKGIHGSVAKLVNDERGLSLKPFWVDGGHRNYFDGCIRDAIQLRRAYRYTLTQCRRHGICDDPADYRHTRVFVDVERAVDRALALKAFLENVPYARYDRRRLKS